jgi:hypothetical protein
MHQVAALALHAMLTAAGLGVLVGIGALRSRDRSLSAGVALVGLAYVTGYCAVFAACTALLAVGVPYSLPTVISVCVAGALPLLLTAARNLPRVRPLAVVAAPRSRAEVVGLAVAAGVFALGLATQIRVPLTEWDAWAIWTNKANILTNLDHLPVKTFTSDAFAFAHPDYPIGLPLWEAAHFRAIGRVDTSHVMALDWLFLCACLLGAYALRPVALPARVAVPVLVGVGLTLLPGATSGYADVPVGLLLMLGTLSLLRWLQDGESSDVRLAVVLLGGAAITKNEGLMGAIALWAAILVCRPRGAWRPTAIAAVAWAALFCAPWRAWVAAHDISGDLHLGNALSPSYLVEHGERLAPILDALTRSLLSSPTMLMLPLGLGGLIAFGRPGAAARFSVIAIALYAGALIVVYWISPHEIGWHLQTSADRTFRTLGLLAVPALLFAADATAQRSTTNAPDNLRAPS